MFLSKFFRDTRYVLLMTENYAALRVLEKTFPDEYANASVIFGSSFPKDQEFTQVHMLLSMQIYKEKANRSGSSFVESEDPLDEWTPSSVFVKNMKCYIENVFLRLPKYVSKCCR